MAKGRPRLYHTCQVPGCEKKHNAKGYCRYHHYHFIIVPSKPKKVRISRERKKVYSTCNKCGENNVEIVKKSEGFEINICQNCLNKQKTGRENAILKYNVICNHEKIGRAGSICNNCYNKLWREKASEICLDCGGFTKKSLHPICPSCKIPKIKKQVITITDINLMRIFLVKDRENLLNVLDIFRMTHLFLNLNKNSLQLDRYHTAGEAKDFVLNTFKTILKSIS